MAHGGGGIPIHQKRHTNKYKTLLKENKQNIYRHTYTHKQTNKQKDTDVGTVHSSPKKTQRRLEWHRNQPLARGIVTRPQFSVTLTRIDLDATPQMRHTSNLLLQHHWLRRKKAQFGNEKKNLLKLECTAV